MIIVESVNHVLREVASERGRQDAQWGEQNHPDGTDPVFARTRDAARDICDQRHQAGLGTWTDIFREEVYEALAETDPEALRRELIQVAAVAVQWVEAIDRRQP